MTLAVKLVIAVIGLVAAYLTLGAAVLNSGDTHIDGYEPGRQQSECVYDGSYDACGGSR